MSGAAGSWSAYWRNSESKKKSMSRIGAADDYQEADGIEILTYAQAQALAVKWFHDKIQQSLYDDDSQVYVEGTYTVSEALRDYFLDAARRGMKSLKIDQLRAKSRIIPELGNAPVSRLTKKRLEAWLDKMANSPKRFRAKTGHEHTCAAPPSTEDEKRARKASANKVLTILKAALNHALQRGKVCLQIANHEKPPALSGAFDSQIKCLDNY
jgi:hypothetical protein